MRCPGAYSYDLRHYKKLYATYMVEAMDGKGDCKYTEVLHLWQVVIRAMVTPKKTVGIIGVFLQTLFSRSHPDNIINHSEVRTWIGILFHAIC
jgi:hypothetical protein